MAEPFVVSDVSELRALQRTFREAKFCLEADDTEVAESPIVARLFERLIATLLEVDAERDGEIARRRWMQWLAIDESRDEWAVALRRARDNTKWQTFTADERREYMTVLLSPFLVTQEILKRFEEAVEGPGHGVIGR